MFLILIALITGILLGQYIKLNISADLIAWVQSGFQLLPKLPGYVDRTWSAIDARRKELPRPIEHQQPESAQALNAALNLTNGKSSK